MYCTLTHLLHKDAKLVKLSSIAPSIFAQSCCLVELIVIAQKPHFVIR
jgi:hypothetical protein